MRMLFAADLHYVLKQFDWVMAQAADYDAVIIGGDLLDLGSALDLDIQIVVIGKYLERLRGLTRLFVSSGNHDGDRRDTSGELVARWIVEAKSPQAFVDGDSVELEGILISVCRWWDGPVSRAEVESQLARDAERPKSKWIWIHHAPPNHSPVSWTGRTDGGDEVLSEWVDRYQPDVVLSGHIHNAPFYPDGSWIDRRGRTWVFNPGRQLGPRPAIIALDLEQMTAEWRSQEGHELRQLGVEPGPGLTDLSAAGA